MTYDYSEFGYYTHTKICIICLLLFNKRFLLWMQDEWIINLGKNWAFHRKTYIILYTDTVGIPVCNERISQSRSIGARTFARVRRDRFYKWAHTKPLKEQGLSIHTETHILHTHTHTQTFTQRVLTARKLLAYSAHSFVTSRSRSPAPDNGNAHERLRISRRDADYTGYEIRAGLAASLSLLYTRRVSCRRCCCCCC